MHFFCGSSVTKETMVNRLLPGSDRTRVKIVIPKLDGCFTGTGDLFAALMLAWMHKTNDIKVALQNTVASIQGVLKRTLSHAKGEVIFSCGFSVCSGTFFRHRTVKEKHRTSPNSEQGGLGKPSGFYFRRGVLGSVSTIFVCLPI